MTPAEVFEVPDELTKLHRNQLAEIADSAGVPITDGPSPEELRRRITRSAL